ncbi:RHS repeat-associated core domain-containing protein [Acidovorax sp. 106]|uniref:RHS repeat-associated core domain-containing protein n=1 Tax=Acidovorax sp. 106 TaxID=2135637 RepID=UPI000EB3F9E1|nr:RHS repeat-associated core domain-containing protein [Acidovorax sp. 106]RLJ38146.1 RHS repeat-associated protein [Acidovorax sp. 106]
MFIATANREESDRYQVIDSERLSPRRPTNTHGQVVWQWLITGDGEVAPTTGATGYAFEAPQLGGTNTSGSVYSEEVNSKLRYSGQVWVEETGLSYNLNRYYDLQAGRYVQAVPIGLDGGRPAPTLPRCERGRSGELPPSCITEG